MKNITIENKRVVCRLDLNVPLKNGIITDDYRITSALKTIQYILSKKPKYLMITAHFGRPKGVGYEEKYSMKFLAPILSQHLGVDVTFLSDGICEATLNILNTKTNGIYLLENLRFHKQETDYENMDDNDRLNNVVIQNYKDMGDIFICDAFGCVHREHMSICAIKTFGKEFGYGDLIQKEVKAIDLLINNPNWNKLAIIGGNKIKDKLPIVDSFRLIQNTKVFVAGGLAKQYDEKHDNVVIMNDGYGNTDLLLPPLYINDVKLTEYNTYDIGNKSTERLYKLINEADVIFWNGSLGVIEHDVYKRGSMQFIEILQNMKDKVIIMGGGETASLVEDKNKNIYVSTGGGALLEYLEKKLNKSKLLVGLDIFAE
jgi:phosphoglycerate kinase